jgi:hypothetical protein
MNSVQLLEELLATARIVTERYLEDLSFEEICLTPGIGANPIAWQLGHLILSEVEMIEQLSKDNPFPFPLAFQQLHRKPGLDHSGGLIPSDRGMWQPWIDEVQGLFSKETYVSLLQISRSKSIEVLRKLTLEELTKPAPEPMAKYTKTWASVFVMIGLHETQHAGQIAVLRRSLGRRVVI